MRATVKTIGIFQILCILPHFFGRALSTSPHSTNSLKSEYLSIAQFTNRNPQNVPAPQAPSPQESTGLEWPNPSFPLVFAILLGCALVIVIAFLFWIGFYASKLRRRERTALLERVPVRFMRRSSRIPGLHPSPPSSPRIMSVQSDSSRQTATYRPSAPPPPPRRATSTSAPEDELISFKMNREKAADPCGICLEPFDRVDVTAGQCMHVFHTTCLKAWLAKEASQKLCPLCRNPFHSRTQKTRQSILIRRSLESSHDLVTAANLGFSDLRVQ